MGVYLLLGSCLLVVNKFVEPHLGVTVIALAIAKENIAIRQIKIRQIFQGSKFELCRVHFSGKKLLNFHKVRW